MLTKQKTTLTTLKVRGDLSAFDPNEAIFFKHLGYEMYRSTKQAILKKKNILFLIPLISRIR